MNNSAQQDPHSKALGLFFWRFSEDFAARLCSEIAK
jgi:hypothetical protein